MSQSLPPQRDQDIPLPSERLRYKVAGSDFAEWFIKSGRLSVLDLDNALASIGRSFGEFGDILEWGCGCGRILRHLPRLQAPGRVCGNDIDPEATAWVDQNMPWIETSLTAGLPPLPYPDDSFDLIYNHSVMTHLDATYQDAWLSELRRVIRPGGIITLTVAARNAFQMYLDGMPADSPHWTTQASKLHTEGLVYIDQDQWTDDFPDFYHTAFHDVPYVFNHWAKFFDVRSYIPRGALGYQDMVVLQKPLAGADLPRGYLDFVNARVADEAARPQRAEAGQAAAAQRVEELERSLDRLRQSAAEASQRAGLELLEEKARGDGLASQLQHVYASRSWLLTRPWRSVGGLIKGRGNKGG